MKTELKTVLEKKTLNPRDCNHATPYMVDNGILDIYLCDRFRGSCYFEPNGGIPFKKICEESNRPV